jgi:hypothetical protein
MLPILPMLPEKGGPKMADIGEPIRRVRVIPRRKLPEPPPEPTPEPTPRREPEKEPSEAPRRKKREKVPG